MIVNIFLLLLNNSELKPFVNEKFDEQMDSFFIDFDQVVITIVLHYFIILNVIFMVYFNDNSIPNTM